MTERSFENNENLRSKEQLQKQAYAMILGGAVGDAYGMPIEGWNRAQITKYIGELREIVDPQEFYLNVYLNNETEEDFPFKFTTRGLPKGSYTDDTYLTLMVGNALVKGGLSLEHAASEHVRMFDEIEANSPDSWNSFGRATTAAIQNLAKGVLPQESGVMAPSPGNGPAIKMGPVGLHIHATGKYDKGLDFAEEVGEMTHKSPSSIAAGIAQAHGVCSLLSGVSRNVFVDTMTAVVGNFENRRGFEPKMSSRLSWVKDNMDVSVDEAYNKFGSTFSVLSNYPLTVFMVQKYWDKPFEGLIKTVNLGGDSDSIGAMYGTLMGAKHGIFMPDEWVGGIRDKEPLVQLSKGLANLK